MTPTFKISGIEYTFHDVTIKNYYEITDLLKKNEPGVEFQVASILTKCPVDLLRKLKYNDWIIIWDELELRIQELLGRDTQIHSTITFKGIEYGLPTVENMSIGEFVDLDLLVNGGNIESRLLEIASIIYRPVIRKTGEFVEVEEYDTPGYQRRMELFKDLPIGSIHSAQRFFFQYVNRSIKNIVESLTQMEEMKQLPMEDQEKLLSLNQQEFGGEYSMIWLETILLRLKQLRNYKLDQHSPGWLGKSTKTKRKSWKQKLTGIVDKIKKK